MTDERNVRNGSKADSNDLTGRNGWKAAIRRTSRFRVSNRDFLVVYDYGMGGVWGFAARRGNERRDDASPETAAVATAALS